MLGLGAPGELDLGEIPAGVKPTPGGGIIPIWTLDHDTLLGNPTNAVALAREVPLGAGLQFVQGALVSSAPPGPPGPPGPGATPAGNSGDIQFNNSGAFGADNKLYWDNVNNRLGLSTTSPQALLHAAGDIWITGGAAGLRLENTNTGGLAYFLQAQLSGLSNAGFEIYDVAAGARRFGIDNLGRVGILTSLAVGKDTPQFTLDVSGTGAFSGNVGIGTTPTSNALTIHVPGGINRGIDITQAGASSFDTAPNLFYYNQILVNGDQVSSSLPGFAGGLWTYALNVEMHTGGPNSNTSKSAFVTNLHKDIDSPGACDHASAYFNMYGNANAGPAGSSTLASAAFGLGVLPGANNYNWVGIAELDAFLFGGSANWRFGLNAADGRADGSPVPPSGDFAYGVSSVSSGWQKGLNFTTLNGPQPVATNGTLIGSEAFTANIGVDFHLANLAYFLIGPNNTFYVTGAGVAVSNGTALTSDATLKSDIQDVSYGLDDLMQIRVREASIFPDPIIRPTIVAQELQPVIPEAVIERPDGKLAIDYSMSLLSVTIKSIQDLAKRVATLEGPQSDIGKAPLVRRQIRKTDQRPVSSKHPELRDGEIFIGNVSRATRYLIKRKQLGHAFADERFGEVAYDHNNNIMAHLKPAFIPMTTAQKTGRKIDMQNMTWAAEEARTGR
jgi:hypothetical protein